MFIDPGMLEWLRAPAPYPAVIVSTSNRPEPAQRAVHGQDELITLMTNMMEAAGYGVKSEN